MSEQYADGLSISGPTSYTPDTPSSMPIRSTRPSHGDVSLWSPTLEIPDADLATDGLAIYGSCQEKSSDFWQASRHDYEPQHSFGTVYPLGTSVDTNSDTAWSPTLHNASADLDLQYEDWKLLDQPRMYSWTDVSDTTSMPSPVGSISGTYLFTSLMTGNRDVGGSEYGSFEPCTPIEQQFSVLQLPMPCRWDFTYNDVLDLSGFDRAQNCKSDIYSESLGSEFTIEGGFSSQSVGGNGHAEPGLSHPRAHVSKSICPKPGCGKDFSYSADLSRHVKTMHSEAGRGYRCKIEGCNKAYKIWQRLDSFKKHTRTQHLSGGAADVKGVVRKSRTDQHDLPVFLTTPEMILERGSRPRARASNQRLRPQ